MKYTKYDIIEDILKYVDENNITWRVLTITDVGDATISIKYSTQQVGNGPVVRYMLFAQDETGRYTIKMKYLYDMVLNYVSLLYKDERYLNNEFYDNHRNDICKLIDNSELSEIKINLI